MARTASPQLDANAKKRLARLLASPQYGPKFRRLNKSDQAVVTALIKQNRGVLARQEVIARDAERLNTRRIRDRVRRYAAKTKADRTSEWRQTQDLNEGDLSSKEFWELYLIEKNAGNLR